jgi:hypothetical protein
MTRSIYKYSPPDVLEVMFARDNLCGIKCSYPKDYNDPYELFLSVDLAGSTDTLATYREIVQELPQYPTTCFSKAPTVSPMWAHYAQNHAGFVLEFDAEAIEKHFEDVLIKDVTYRDAPDPEIEYFLRRSAVTMKARHAIWLQQMVIAQAYYTKFTPWQYEEECRLVASDGDVEDVSGHKILFVPTDCLSTIIVGKNASEELVQRSKEIAAKHDIQWLRSKVGKSTSLPFFTTQDGSVLTFRDGDIAVTEAKCGACSEPVDEEEELCPWCKISDQDAYEAARANPLRAFAHFGMLDDYLKSVEAIERAGRRGRRKK